MSDPYGEDITNTEEMIRCWRCKKLLAEVVTHPWQIKCPRCKALNRHGEFTQTESED